MRDVWALANLRDLVRSVVLESESLICAERKYLLDRLENALKQPNYGPPKEVHPCPVCGQPCGEWLCDVSGNGSGPGVCSVKCVETAQARLRSTVANFPGCETKGRCVNQRCHTAMRCMYTDLHKADL